MRKIWSSRRDKDRDREGDKEKRKSFTGINSLYYAPSNQTAVTSRDSVEFDPSLYSQQSHQPIPSKQDFHDDATFAHSVQESGLTANTAVSTAVSASTSTTKLSSHTDSALSLPSPKAPKSISGLVKYDYDAHLVKNSWVNVVVNTSVNDVDDQSLRLYRAELKGSHLYLYKSNLNYRSFKSDDYRITFFETAVPHPDLRFSFDTYSFQPDCTIESLLHFVLFSNDDNFQSTVHQAITILPLFPDFGKTLRLLNLILTNLFGDKFSGKYDLSVAFDRILQLLNNVDNNLQGFLLKSDIAPYILRLLEILSDKLSPSSEDSEEYSGFLSQLTTFKSSMLLHQQNLIHLISNDNDKAPESNPFQDLNASYFLNHVKLIDFATTVNAIDLKFYKDWNSNIDKSLLLYSTINQTNQSGSVDIFYRRNSLFFNNEFHIHFLSRLFINQMFLETNITGMNSSTSLLEFKARLLEKWIDLGCLLDKSGNMSSWLGIASIILSQPILRLNKIWSFVSLDYIKLLKNDWSPVLFELDRRFLVNGINASTPNSPNQQKSSEENSTDPSPRDSYHIMAPRGLGKVYAKENVVPYFGDLLLNNLVINNINELDSIYKKINYSFNRWSEYSKNLTNYDDIIKYNDDVLKRYDSMGFIFSNESLNQVLYLGVNEDSKSLPPTFEIPKDNEKGDHGLNYNVTTNPVLQSQLLKLIDLNSNSESFNLEKLMLLSLTFQPELPESYLRSNHPVYKNFHATHSNISVNSNDSLASLKVEGSMNVHDPTSRLPTFNNNHFKFNLIKYDDLTNDSGISNQFHSESNDSKHKIKVGNDLTFRIDDFVTDLDNQTNSTLNPLDEVGNEDDDDEVTGLGIDVDDILNSDKFNNFLMSNDPSSSESDQVNSSKKTSTNLLSHPTNSFSVISSDSSQLHIYKYIPKLSTIEKLIDLLIIDTKYLDESISIDLSEYRYVFLLNYNSYITTRELLDKLAYRFINSGNAVISIMKKLHAMKTNQSQDKQSDEDFPNWNLDNSVDLTELGEVDYSVLLKIQINILKVLVLLINNFYSNFSMDLMNKKILIKLLKLFSNEILQWYNSNKIDSELEKSFESLVNYYKKLKKLFVKKTYRPIELDKFHQFLVNDFKFNNSLHEVPMNRNLPGHKNIQKIEKFLHKFNKLLSIFYKGIKIEDWVKVYKIMEIEFEKNNLMEFKLQKNETVDENLVISNIFNYFDSLNDPNEKLLILKKFPLVFRKLFKLYNKFKTYILIQLTDLNITVDERLDRMKTLLYMVKLCQLKMSSTQFVFESRHKGPIPSCIESSITNVIYSPESRLFTNLWIKASIALNGEDFVETSTSFDDLNSLLPKHITIKDLAIHHEFLLPCFGWIIENMVEMNRIPNFTAKSQINFNKRYFIYKVLKELTIEDVDLDEFNHNETREFEFLLKLDENLINDKNIKEFTFLEKDRAKLFKAVLKEQHKVLLIDNRKKHLKDGNVSTSSLHSTSSQSSVNGSLHKKSSNPGLRRQSLSYKQSNSGSRFKISGFFTKSRPFSIGGNGSNPGQHWYDKPINAKELPNADNFIAAKSKPAHIIPLKNKKIFPVYLLPLSFKIDSDSNKEEDYFFQCLNETDLNDWLMKLSYANRHWFFSRSLNIKSSSGNFTTFGIPLGVTCNRQNTFVPKFLLEIFKAIEAEGLKDVGVYRISTSLSELTNLKSMIDKVGFIDFEERSYDTHALTSCVKSYFRELPDALLNDKAIEKCYDLRQSIANEEIDKIEMILRAKEIFKSLPKTNYETLKALLKHLTKVEEFSEYNKMNPTNLATVIGPALTEASGLEVLVNSFGFMNFVLERIIINYQEIFEFTHTITDADQNSQAEPQVSAPEKVQTSKADVIEISESAIDVSELRNEEQVV
ncbi:hypothetical protein CANTEDRAFT_131500 [Yamadazyma tenuis ATCC 10573]|uniref:Rho-GAP domain-containing protein n=1 Tax=Candida tenuis (strain ATCC 10573 / BCRC 21748 / CBS 615 / JCM 9827 / NBRC 10315 / NRRL Y-1498 / VKM Y-70) TaxID=590646 RepID=G3BAH9_CANTC|nr:uncharacterized protein CANTEDRAFT_131500 [Yamadazyma tenuis ATCC 10573]EGV62065.1 hypothetical protein CANTEDRAFT_131500 [Yamadazyma tenuis ATCC 10573]